jgi:cytochrome P450
VHELLNKRGAVFSDRPVDDQWELATKNGVLILMHPDQTWRAVKKIASQALTPKALDGSLADVFEAE